MKSISELRLPCDLQVLKRTRMKSSSKSASVSVLPEFFVFDCFLKTSNGLMFPVVGETH